MESHHEIVLNFRVTKDEARLIGLALARKLKPQDHQAAGKLNERLLEQRKKALEEEMRNVDQARIHAKELNEEDQHDPD